MLKTIGDVCQLLNGYSFKSEKYVDSGIRIIRIANVQKGFIEDNSPAFYPLETPGIENYMLKEGDLLISLTGNVGRVALLNKEMLPAALNQRVACLRIKDDSIYKNFLFHYLNSSKFENTCILESRGVAQKNMSTEWLKRQPIPNYTLQNQIKISKILDSIIEIINKKRQQLVEFDSLIKSRFVEMFGDPESNTKKYPMVNLSDIAQYFNGLTYRPENVSDEGVIVLRSSNIQNSKLDFKDLVRVRLNVKENKMVRENDILMCSRNGSAKLVGKVALIDNLPERMAFGAFMMIIRSEYYAYLLSYFQMDAFRRQITTGATTTINQITSRMLDNVKLPLPEMNEVKDFELLVKQIDKLKFENEILYSIYRFTINKQTKLLGYRGVTL